MEDNYLEVRFTLTEKEQCKCYILRREDGKPLTLDHTEWQIQNVAWQSVNTYVRQLIRQGTIMNKNMDLPSYTFDCEMSEDNCSMYIYMEELCLESLTKEQYQILSYVLGQNNPEMTSRPN